MDITRACAAKKRGSMTAAIATACFHTLARRKTDRWSRYRTCNSTHRHNAHIDRPLRTGTPPDAKLDGTSLTPLLNNAYSNWPERTLFVHQQQIDHPKKYKDFAAMTDHWRLVHTGTWREPQYELFDHKRDPEQKRDIAEHHPDIVQTLREDYENWWTDISRRFGEYSEITIGSESRKPHNANRAQLARERWNLQPAACAPKRARQRILGHRH